MALDWLPRENGLKDHDLWGNEFFGTEAPCIIYENRPIVNPEGKPVEGVYSAWITLNNPAQYNSYTTKMVKGVIAGLNKASMDRNVVAVVLTGAGDKAFCTGGNTKEYAEYYSKRPQEYGLYMDLFNTMVDGLLNCKKPVISRVNGMRVAGGQEVGMACDISLSSDMAVYGQAGPRHGSAPVGGATDFLPWALGIEDAMWNCISCELWSAYKMKYKGLLSKVVPVLKADGKWLRNPQVITEDYIRDGEIVYGEFKTGPEAARARDLAKSAKTDFELLDKAVNDILWTFTNLFPNCLQVSIEGIRQKKKFFWDISKTANRHWLAVNMNSEAFAGFNAFNTKKITGKDQIDFIKFREMMAAGHAMDDELFEAVLGQPK
ncbi:MAG: 6-oxocyclohex-1-ene-1-carbonyl-CoA hydratase [Chloroflexi bacterium]|nr:6-oxocyclohex-1-ene-1-carbonyl-CoA hydratase [Chloroflexota bacterium]MCL5952634.1 6-oxocyclohex-1-ene-1-carbonyl-CoA hydratase [Chloroflexota bacterium]